MHVGLLSKTHLFKGKSHRWETVMLKKAVKKWGKCKVFWFGFFFKSWLRTKMSMLKIALPPGFKIRMCLEQGRGLGLLLKAFFLNRAFHLHCICINVMTEWRDHLWIKLCFGDDIHHTTEFNGGVFPTYIYPYVYQCIYVCIVQYPFHREMTLSPDWCCTLLLLWHSSTFYLAEGEEKQ